MGLSRRFASIGPQKKRKKSKKAGEINPKVNISCGQTLFKFFVGQV
jgi:hypothetical protein